LIVTGHQIPGETIKAAWEVSRRFFDLPTSEKSKVPMTDDYPYGYIGFGEELLQKGLAANTGDERSESLRKVGTAPDLKESLQVCVGPEKEPSPQMKPPKWHDNPADLREKWTAYYRELEKLSAALLRVMALALKLPEQYFEDKIDHHMSVLRALNYPHMETPPMPGQMRAGAHTDYGSLTILLADDAPGGLELYLDGAWHPVKAPAGSFIVNLGDLMQRWTNDQWKSTLHRVVPPPPDASGSTRRQSMAFFHNINPDTKVECIPSCLLSDGSAKYPPITAGEWLMQKHYSTIEKK
jgi:isopenicillin N synthase-like dioxygenase